MDCRFQGRSSVEIAGNPFAAKRQEAAMSRVKLNQLVEAVFDEDFGSTTYDDEALLAGLEQDAGYAAESDLSLFGLSTEEI
jgi:hypothetical protein